MVVYANDNWAKFCCFLPLETEFVFLLMTVWPHRRSNRWLFIISPVPWVWPGPPLRAPTFNEHATCWWSLSSHYLLIELISWAEPLQSRTWWLFSQRVDQRRDLLGAVFLPGFTSPVNQTGYNEEVCLRTENRARSGWKERKDLILAAWSSACDRTHTRTPI